MDKIRTGIGLALGAIGGIATGGRNVVVEQINKAVEQDIREQRLDIKDMLAKKAAAIDFINAEIDMKKQGVKDELMLQKMEQTQAALAQERVGALNKAMTLDKIAKGQGLSMGELNTLPKEQQDKAVILPNNNIVLAANKSLADSINRKQSEVLPAIKGISRVFDVIADDMTAPLSPSRRAEVATEIQALVGQLRLPFTGPGAMTDREYERILDTLGNPNKLFALPGVERKKLETVLNKLQSDLKEGYRQGGIKVPESANEKNINLIMKTKNASRAEAINALKKAGKFKTDSLF